MSEKISTHVDECQYKTKRLERQIADCRALTKRHTAEVLSEWDEKEATITAALRENKPASLTYQWLNLKFEKPAGKYRVRTELDDCLASSTRSCNECTTAKNVWFHADRTMVEIHSIHQMHSHDFNRLIVLNFHSEHVG